MDGIIPKNRKQVKFNRITIQAYIEMTTQTHNSPSTYKETPWFLITRIISFF